MAKKKYIVGVTACQIGIAHTFMAADSLRAALEEAGCEAKIETQGALEQSMLLPTRTLLVRMAQSLPRTSRSKARSALIRFPRSAAKPRKS